MIQINEFGLALILFILSTAAFTIQIFTSEIFPKNKIIRLAVKVFVLVLAITLNCFFGLVAYRTKGVKAWSNLSRAAQTVVRIVSQERIPSFDKNFPFGWKVVVQTNVVIQPASIVFRCDGEVGKGEVEFAGDAGSMFTKIRSGVLLERRDMFLASFESPAFTPERAMVVMLLSKTPIRVVEFFQAPFSFP